MKKILSILLIIANFAFAAKWYSNTGEDGYTFQQAIEELNDIIEELNDEVKERYEELNKNQVENILKGFKKKKRLLTNIQNLSREDDILKLNELHEIMIKKELDGLLIDTWSTE